MNTSTLHLTAGLVLLLLPGMLLPSAAVAAEDCQKSYDHCSRACDDANDCPGGCLGCTLGCLIAKWICESNPAGPDAFAAFDPADGEPGLGPVRRYDPGEVLVLRAGLLPVATSDGFPFKRHAAFLDPERAGVVDVYAEYRLRAGGDDASPGDWRPARGLYPPPSGTDDPVWEVVVPTESSDSEARGYAVRLHFLMADGSVRTADTVLLPSEAIDAAAWCEKP